VWNRWSRRRCTILGVIGVAVALSVVLLLLLVPVSQEPAGYTFLGPRLYSYESESLFGPGTGWENFTFRGVTFGFHLWCAIRIDVGTVCGNATGPNGVAHPYDFADGLPRAGPATWETWVSPDGHEGVEYQDGGQVHLLVEG
jgi:hypothetical protein